MNTQLAIDTIHRRHIGALQRTSGDSCDLSAVRLSLYLALDELAEWLAAEWQVADWANQVAASAAQTAAAQAAATPVAEEQPAADVPAAVLPQQLAPAAPEPLPAKRRLGRPPGVGRKVQRASADDIAAQLEAGQLDPSLITAEDSGGLKGKLVREEVVKHKINGQPVQTTRQYIEVR